MKIPLPQPDQRMRKLHPKQMALWRSKARFRTVACGRRSGKTAIAMRYLRREALSQTEYDDAWYVCAGPTREQAKRIFWSPLKKLIPDQFVSGINESSLTIRLVNGSEITVMGMDKPERIEGKPINGLLLDEYANMKPQVLDEHVRPMLSERGAWAWFLGVPEGRNHYYDLCTDSKTDDSGMWEHFHWTTEEILPIYLGEERAAIEIAEAKKRMDPLTYKQEYLADFVSFEGLAYYQFDFEANCPAEPLEYYPQEKLIFCFDFNVSPGTASVVQEYAGKTRVIDEVYIEKGSTTPMVCRKLLQSWGHHRGMVYGYGDATGGNPGTAKVAGSDWDLIDKIMRGHFGHRWVNRVPRSNPPERSRVNAVNSRLKSMDGQVHLLIDRRCKYMIKDFEGVRLVKGSAGEIDKKFDKKLTHLTDGLGYYIAQEFPVVEHVVSARQY